jgi:hypothetical protein
MYDTRGALQEIADTLTAAGTSAFVDPRDADLPGVWVQRNLMALDLLGSCATLRIRLLMVSPNVGTWDALGFLDELETACTALMRPNVNAGIVSDRGDVLLPDNPTLYPGRWYDVDVQIEPEPEPAP